MAATVSVLDGKGSNNGSKNRDENEPEKRRNAGVGLAGVGARRCRRSLVWLVLVEVAGAQWAVAACLLSLRVLRKK